MSFFSSRGGSVATALAAALLAGCASFSPDGGTSAVSELTRAHVGHGVAAISAEGDIGAGAPDTASPERARADALLSHPLTADGAVELALLRSRGLQARLAALRGAEADLVAAGRPRNPGFGFERLSGGGSVEIDRSVTIDVLGLLAIPLARGVEEGRYREAQFAVAADALGVADAARRAWFDAVAAAELVRYFEQVQETADASHALMQRMVEAGNAPALAQWREQAFRADAATDLAQARHEALAARERLVRALGLDADHARLQLPERLPPLPDAPIAPHAAEQAAIDRRLDVQQARLAVESTARSLGLVRTTGFIDAFDLGWRDRRETGQPRARGYAVEFSLPLFDFGRVRGERARAAWERALHEAADTGLAARAQARTAWSGWRVAYEHARRQRDEMLPLRERIAEENLLRYNGMLIGVFDLLADAREQVRAVAASVRATHAFWIADADLRAAWAGAPARR